MERDPLEQTIFYLREIYGASTCVRFDSKWEHKTVLEIVIERKGHTLKIRVNALEMITLSNIYGFNAAFNKLANIINMILAQKGLA